jgi:hypothetical protein
MSQRRSVGGLFTLQPGKQVSWTTTYPNGRDAGVVIQAPNIVDDVIGTMSLIAVNQGVVATSSNSLSYTVLISNLGTQAVSHNLNIQDWL